MPPSKGAAKNEMKMKEIMTKDNKIKKEQTSSDCGFACEPSVTKRAARKTKPWHLWMQPSSSMIAKEAASKKKEKVRFIMPPMIMKKEMKKEMMSNSSAAGSSPRGLKLMSSDSVVFAVEAATAKQMPAISGFVGYSCPIKLHNLTGDILASVIQYCKRHAATDGSTSSAAAASKGASTETVEAWDKEFIKEFDLRTLWDIKLAADYLNVEGLVNLTCKVINSMIVGKSATEVRRLLELKGESTPEEEEILSKFDKWTF